MMACHPSRVRFCAMASPTPILAAAPEPRTAPTSAPAADVPALDPRAECVQTILRLQEELLELDAKIREAEQDESALLFPEAIAKWRGMRDEVRHDLEWSQKELGWMDAATDLKLRERMAGAAEISAAASAASARSSTWAALAGAFAALAALLASLLR